MGELEKAKARCAKAEKKAAIMKAALWGLSGEARRRAQIALAHQNEELQRCRIEVGVLKRAFKLPELFLQEARKKLDENTFADIMALAKEREAAFKKGMKTNA